MYGTLKTMAAPLDVMSTRPPGFIQTGAGVENQNVRLLFGDDAAHQRDVRCIAGDGRRTDPRSRGELRRLARHYRHMRATPDERLRHREAESCAAAGDDDALVK
jgi:hypothetical protein